MATEQGAVVVVVGCEWGMRRRVGLLERFNLLNLRVCRKGRVGFELEGRSRFRYGGGGGGSSSAAIVSPETQKMVYLYLFYGWSLSFGIFLSTISPFFLFFVFTKTKGHGIVCI